MIMVADVAKHWQNYYLAGFLYRRALSMEEKALGPTHPEVVRCKLTLADWQENQGRWVTASALLGKFEARGIEKKSKIILYAVPKHERGITTSIMRCFCHSGGLRGDNEARDGSLDPEKAPVWSPTRPEAHKTVVTLLKKPVLGVY